MTTHLEPAASPDAPAASAPGWAAPLSGVVAGTVGLAVAELTAWRVAPAGSPVPAVGELVITLLPAALVNLGKDVLGFADKPVLVAIILLGLLAAYGLAGRLERRRPGLGLAVFALLAGVAAVGVSVPMVGLASSPSGHPGGLIRYAPTAAGLLAGGVLLRMLVTRAPAAATSPDRRRFLTLALALGAAGAVGATAGRFLTAAAARVEQAREALRLPPPAVAAPPVPAGADLGIQGGYPYVTPNEDFYRIDTALQVPAIDPADWSLRITGRVAREVTLSYDELVALPLVEHDVTLTCVSNDVGGHLVGNARWLGHPVRDLLARAGPEPGADMVLSVSEDGWTAGTPLDALTDPGREALLAVGMNGEPLPAEHGFPVRMVVPGLYGYVSATKWVRELRVTTFADDEGYWTPLGWSARGPVKLASRIDVPRSNESTPAGPVVVAGVAWAQHTGVAAVEVSVDGGAWQAVELAPTVGPDTWRQWRWTWPATPGRHTLAVRAVDAAGAVQTAAEAPPEPDGATGHHTVEVTVS